MTMIFKKFYKLFYLTMASAFLTFEIGEGTPLAMEIESEGGVSQGKSTLSLDTQMALTTYGHTLLKQVLSDEGLETITGQIFEDVKNILGKDFGHSFYAPLTSSLAPSNLLRWKWASTDTDYNTKRKDHLSALIAISWALVDMVKKQGDYFERGSVSIIDPNERFYNFLLDYVKLTTGSDNPQTLLYVMTTSNFAYRRDPQLYASTHHSGHCLDSQFGMDVRFEPWEGVRKLYPFDFTHLLFAKLSIGGQHEPLVFVKWEEVGMGSIAETANHFSGFWKSKGTVESTARREKDIPPELREAIELFKSEMKLTEDFKKIRPAYVAGLGILNATRSGKEAYEEHERFLEDNTFQEHIEEGSGILASLYEVDPQHKVQADLYDRALKFLDTVDTFYPNGNNHLRVGNEVILDLSKI